MDPFSSASICHIDLGALRRNFSRLGSPDSLMPVVKSDAYGHGMLPVSKALAGAGARRLAVGLASEGVMLRQAGFQGQIVLLLGCLDEADRQMAIQFNLTPVIGDFEALGAFEDVAGACGPRGLEIAVACNTGMNRLGFNGEEISAACERLKAHGNLKPAILISHLACADMPAECAFNRGQIAEFNRIHECARAWFPQIRGSLGNSAALLREAPAGILRPGLALYGYNPFPGEGGFEPVMALSSPIISIRELAPGQSLSYGRVFVAAKRTRVAVVALGYASGLPRGLSGKFDMLARGRRAPQIGRICMGMSMLDITGLDDVRVGDRAWLIGGRARAGVRNVDAQELADRAATIPYELLCVLGALNRRVYTEEA